MSVHDDTIAAFADLVARAESDAGPKAELARFQLQGLVGSLQSLADDGLPPEVESALGVLRSFVQASAGAVDPAEGEALREKVSAYAVLADDLGLDDVRLHDLLDRWDRATAPKAAPARGRARRAPGAVVGKEACPVCGESFTRVRKHMSAAHPEEWARLKGS